MGMRKEDIKHLYDCFKDADMPRDMSKIRMCELGSQIIRAKGLGTRKISKNYFTSLGIDHVSIDLNGKYDSLPYDLTKPITDIGTFDVVTNYGTTEHVENQYAVFSNMHGLCRKNGFLVHKIPLTKAVRWINHGLYEYSFSFFYKLAEYCRYEITRESTSSIELIQIIMKKLEDNSFISEELFNECGVIKK